jgi:hypothetical protein
LSLHHRTDKSNQRSRRHGFNVFGTTPDHGTEHRIYRIYRLHHDLLKAVQPENLDCPAKGKENEGKDELRYCGAEIGSFNIPMVDLGTAIQSDHRS